MKKMRKLVLTVYLLTQIAVAFCQSDQMEYRRSSLSVNFISNVDIQTRGAISLINEAVQSYQVSDKFNDHSIGNRFIDIMDIEVTNADIDRLFPRSKTKKVFDTILEIGNQLVNESPQDPTENSIDRKEQERIVATALYKYIRINNVANKLIAKWFNASDVRKENSYFDMDLIKERGVYNASELDKLKANESIRGLAVLQDAGMDLIPNTYITFTLCKYETAKDVFDRQAVIAKENFELLGKEGSKLLTKGEKEYIYKDSIYVDESGRTRNKVVRVQRQPGEKSFLGRYGESFEKKMTTIGNEMHEGYKQQARSTSGYFVTSTTYLFQLIWDKATEELFINKYYNTEDVNTFLNSEEFNVKYLGCHESSSAVTARTSFDMQEENNRKIVKIATTRAIDKSIAGLQKHYEDFRVKAPLIDVGKDSITAFIGTKEGINQKSEFEVLEKIYNEKNNTFRYRRIGKLKVKDDLIWDNRYNIDGVYMENELNEMEVELNNLKTDENKEDLISTSLVKNIKGGKGISVNAESLDRTFFKGAHKKLAPGMLIRQIN